jgi:hypothetical protein
MAMLRKVIFILCSVAFFASCEDVIEVEVEAEQPRLVVDAIIRIDTSQTFFVPEIKVTRSTPFFDSAEPVSNITQMTISNLGDDGLGEGFIIMEEIEPGTGVYREQDPVPVDFFTQGELILQIVHEGRLYFSRTRYVPSVQIDRLEQGDDTLFSEDDTEVIVQITDTPDQENFYVFDFGFNEFLTVEDQFFDGQSFEFSYFYDQDLDTTQEIEVSILGADRGFFDYMTLLIEQTQDDGGVFQTPIAIVRGNVFDVTDLDNDELFDNVAQPDVFPLGYFAIAQEFKATLALEQ